MDLAKAMEERRSVRAFKPDPVPKEKIEAILRLALRAPSAINLQPWELIVVTGEEKERLSRRLMKAYRERQIACGAGNVKPLPKTVAVRGALTLKMMNPFFEKMGVPSNVFINEGSCRFYGAPAAILICMDDSFPDARFVDLGVILAYLLLSAQEFGVGSCPIGLITAYGDEIKELLNIPENKRVVVGVALGYTDPESPINEFKSPRDDFSKFVKWVD
jgi:nitroreductase